MNVPPEWFLSTLGVLALAIAGMAKVMWTFMETRLKAQDKVIDGLQEDVKRLSQGCGSSHCFWHLRRSAGPADPA